MNRKLYEYLYHKPDSELTYDERRRWYGEMYLIELDGQSVPVKALSADDAVMLYRRMFPENEGHIKIYKDCIWPNPDRLLREEIINDLPF